MPCPSFRLRLVCLALVVSGAGCNRGGAPIQDGVRQTGFPGQVTAGGKTSGEVMARAGGAGSGRAGAGQEGMRGQASAGSVAGTPSIAEGAGGTTSGAAMGGTSESAAATKAAPVSGAGAGAGAITVPAQESGKDGK